MGNLNERLKRAERLALRQSQGHHLKLSYWTLNQDGTYSRLEGEKLDPAPGAPALSREDFEQVSGIRVLYLHT